MAKKKKKVFRSLVLTIHKDISEPSEKAYEARLNRIIEALEDLEWNVTVESEEDIEDDPFEDEE